MFKLNFTKKEEIRLKWKFDFFFKKKFSNISLAFYYNVSIPKSVKILSPWCKVREKIGKKSVIFTDFDFDFLIFNGHKIEKKKSPS